MDIQVIKKEGKNPSFFLLFLKKIVSLKSKKESLENNFLNEFLDFRKI